MSDELSIAKPKTGALAIPEEQLIDVLRNSLYPGAQTASILLVLDYCKAAGLDPMQKPVHIVPMWDRASGGMRDVIMPGVGLYRTQAARTGQFAGMSEPEFGPEVTRNIGGQDISYPEWAKVTVKRALPSGQIAEFTAVEYWTENYAVKGGKEKSIAPNAMWTKRPRGQIAKCASAQALRIAFPELGAQATAEEMEGKSLSGDEAIDLPKPIPEALMAEARAAAEMGSVAYAAFFQATGKDNRKLLVSAHEGLKARAKQADSPPADVTDVEDKTAMTDEQREFAQELGE